MRHVRTVGIICWHSFARIDRQRSLRGQVRGVLGASQVNYLHFVADTAVLLLRAALFTSESVKLEDVRSSLRACGY